MKQNWRLKQKEEINRLDKQKQRIEGLLYFFMYIAIAKVLLIEGSRLNVVFRSKA